LNRFRLPFAGRSAVACSYGREVRRPGCNLHMPTATARDGSQSLPKMDRESVSIGRDRRPYPPFLAPVSVFLPIGGRFALQPIREPTSLPESVKLASGQEKATVSDIATRRPLPRALLARGTYCAPQRD
jgi:hypothetical protein